MASLRTRLATRAAEWARRRQGDDQLPLVLRSRRIYILPTRAGLGFALLLLVMLVAGLNYTNSLALLLTFLLAGYALVGMHECHRTLQGLELIDAQAQDCHAGETGTLELHFANRAAVRRGALSVRCPQASASHFELEPGATVVVRAAFAARRRGRLQLGRLELATTAPFGLFRAWAWLHLPLAAIVYPRAEGQRPLPRAARSAQAANISGGNEEEQWSSLRTYQAGDSPHSIAWKAYARGAPLMVAQYEGAGGSEYLLSFAGLESLDAEARLCQLSAWVLACDQLGADCALRLPSVELPLGHGALHRSTLLRALALHDELAA